MYEALVFLVEGFEEIEALAVIDILRRGGVKLASVSLTGKNWVMGSHDITVMADLDFKAIEWDINTMFILPGGPGTKNYKEHNAFLQTLREHHASGGPISAICAAPSVLGMLGFLENKTACCFPGFEKELTGAHINAGPVEVDGKIITGKNAGASLLFGATVLAAIKGKVVSDNIRSTMGF